MTPSLHHYNTFTELLQLREPDDWRRLRSGRYHSSSDLELATLVTPHRDNRTRTSSLPTPLLETTLSQFCFFRSPPTTALRETNSPEPVRSRPSRGSESPPPPRIPNHCTTRPRTRALPVPVSQAQPSVIVIAKHKVQKLIIIEHLLHTRRMSVRHEINHLILQAPNNLQVKVLHVTVPQVNQDSRKSLTLLTNLEEAIDTSQLTNNSTTSEIYFEKVINVPCLKILVRKMWVNSQVLF